MSIKVQKISFFIAGITLLINIVITTNLNAVASCNCFQNGSPTAFTVGVDCTACIPSPDDWQNKCTSAGYNQDKSAVDIIDATCTACNDWDCTGEGSKHNAGEKEHTTPSLNKSIKK